MSNQKCALKEDQEEVDGLTNLPGNWQQFLQIDENKTKLFAFLANHITRLVTHKLVVTINGSDVLCIPSWDTSFLACCDCEEADTRMIWQIQSWNVSARFFCIQWIQVCVVLAVAEAAKLDV